MSQTLGLLFGASFIGLTVWAAITDVKTLKIPNWIPVSIAVLFVIYLLVGPRDLPVLYHVAVALGVLAVSFALFAAGFMGAGDAKMMTAVALWAGPAKIAPFLLGMAVAGVALALLILWARFYAPADDEVPSGWLHKLLPTWISQGVLPYGVAICVGALLTVPDNIF